MTGKSHKFIGLVAGGAAAYYGVTHNPGEAVYLLYILAAPAGAMIADIDHDGSKLGRSRKTFMAVASSLLAAFAIVAITFFLADGYNKGQDKFFQSVLTVILVAAPFLILTALSKTEFIKNNLKFMVKHRGLMHTLIMPGVLFAATYFIKEPTFRIFITGLTIGYITHLLADMLTVRGCPVLFPVTKKNIKFMKIKTGSVPEYIAAAVLSAGAAALMLSGLIGV